MIIKTIVTVYMEKLKKHKNSERVKVNSFEKN